MKRMPKVAVIGCGTVGASWSLLFARAGFEVALYDPSPTATDAALDYALQAGIHLHALGLLNDESPAAVHQRMRSAPSLADAVRNASYIQESAPERLSIKQALYAELSTVADADAVIASSTSGFPASAFTGHIPGRERCLVVHPINPPHLVPLVEIVPAPWTHPGVVDRAIALMRQVGQVPIRLNCEIDGFVVNRLQSAVLAEAFRLVDDGVCSADDVDSAIADGLGLRWFFMGPFETIDLNAQGGIADYCRKLGPMYHDLAKSQATPRIWSEQLIAEVERQRRTRLPAGKLEQRKAWRDRCLGALLRARKEILGKE
jgi:L-gulonate 3-dehydrogenase